MDPGQPPQRKMVMDRLRTWNAFSASNPSKASSERCARTGRPTRRSVCMCWAMSSPARRSIRSSRRCDMVNRTDETGERRVRIHAIGYPVNPAAPQYTSIRFAALMRIICQRNGGTFVGLHEVERRGPRVTVGGAAPDEDQPDQVLVALASASARGRKGRRKADDARFIQLGFSRLNVAFSSSYAKTSA